VLDPLPAYHLRRIVRPSLALADSNAERALDSAAERLAEPRDPEDARKEGVALHALLHHLSKLDPSVWDAVTTKALPELLPDLPERHEWLGRKAKSILSRLDLIHLFGPNSRAELPILAHGTRGGAPVTIAGRIDRLVVEPRLVLVVDYKSDAQVPADENTVPPAYLSQLGLYALVAGQLFPSHRVEAGILWTELESFMNLSQARLRQAVAGFTLR